MQVDCVRSYRWSRILTGRALLGEWRAHLPPGSDDLPVYMAIAVALLATSLQSPIIDGLVIDMLLARIGQALGEVGLPPTKAATSLRFAFFSMEVAGKFAIAP
jgi:hypothetical protein